MEKIASVTLVQFTEAIKIKAIIKKCKYKVRNKAIKRCIAEGWYSSNCYYNLDYETV